MAIKALFGMHYFQPLGLAIFANLFKVLTVSIENQASLHPYFTVTVEVASTYMQRQFNKQSGFLKYAG